MPPRTGFQTEAEPVAGKLRGGHGVEVWDTEKMGPAVADGSYEAGSAAEERARSWARAPTHVEAAPGSRCHALHEIFEAQFSPGIAPRTLSQLSPDISDFAPTNLCPHQGIAA